MDNISAVLEVSVNANPSVYEEIEEEKRMNDAVRRLMKDDLERERADGIKEGMEKGLLSSIGNLMKSMHWSAEEAMKALGIPQDKMDFYSAKLTK
jgi:flagellar biosynthesis/type III secretory pathway protein FliH